MAVSDDMYGNRMAATLADLLSQPISDIASLNNSIHTAEELLANAPADICIPSGFWENFAVLFERRYQQTKDLDDLQAAITWAELAAATIPQDDVSREHCLSKVDAYLVLRNDNRGNPEVPHRVKERMDDATPDAPQDMLTVNSERSLDSLDDMTGPRERINLTVESSSLGSISATLADLVSQPSIDVICLNNTIQLAQEVFADAPDDICLPAGIYKSLSILFERQYQQTKELDDLQSAITWAEQGAAAIPRDMDKLQCLNNLVACLISRYEQTGEVEDLCKAGNQLREINMTLDNLVRTPSNIVGIRSVLETIQQLNIVLESSPLALLDSIWATNLAVQ
jgi:hypothetical protein